MSRGKQMLRELGHAVRDGATEGARVPHYREYGRGFNEAAQICMDVLSEATDGLLARMKPGNLSKQEQALYARLTELTAEMDERLQNACQPEPTGAPLP